LQYNGPSLCGFNVGIKGLNNLYSCFYRLICKRHWKGQEGLYTTRIHILLNNETWQNER